MSIQVRVYPVKGDIQNVSAGKNIKIYIPTK